MLRKLCSYLFIGTILLTACVDVPEGKSPELKAKLTKISGLVSVAAVNDSTVRLFAFESGDKGEVLAETTTAPDGTFSFEITTISQPVLIEASDGEYLSPTSGNWVSLGDYKLRTLINLKAGVDTTVAVTPLSNLAAGSAEYQLAADSGSEVHQIISESNQQISTLYSVDVISVLPCNFPAGGCRNNDSNESKLYALAQSALSNLANNLCNQAKCNDATRQHYSAIAITDLAYRDVKADGLLNGIRFDNNGTRLMPIQLGSSRLNVKFYRTDFAQAILRLGSSNGISSFGLDWDSAVEFALKLNNSELALFNAEPVLPIDNHSPIITYNFNEGDSFNGNVALEFSATDEIGIADITFGLNGSKTKPDNLALPVFAFDSIPLTDGELNLTITATDFFDNVTQETVMIRIANHSPIVSFLSPKLVSSRIYPVNFAVDENDVTVFQVNLNGVAIDLSNLADINTNHTLIPGKNDIVITVIDTDGESYDFNYTISYDDTPPSITVTSPGVNAPEIFNQAGTLETWQPILQPNQTLNITNDTKALDGLVESKQTLSDAHIGFIEFTIEDPVSNDLATPVDALQVAVSYSKNGTDIFNNKPVTNDNGYVIFALADENLSADWADHPVALSQVLTFKVSDQAGATSVYQLDYLAALKAIDTSSTLIDEKYYNRTFNVDLLGDLTETTSASLKISNSTINLDDTQTSNRLTVYSNELSDGRYQAEVSITGLFNNIETENTFINIDNSGPVISNLSYSAFVNTNSALISGKVIDTGIGFDSIYLDGIPTEYNEVKNTFSINAALGSSDGSYILSLNAADILGQSSNSIITIVRDTVKPIVEIRDGPTNGWTNSSTLSVRGECSDDNSGISTVGATIFGVTENGNCIGGSYSARFEFIPDGIHTIHVSTTDAAGNTQTVTSDDSIKMDRTAPTLDGVTVLDRLCYPNPESNNSCTVTHVFTVVSGDNLSGVASVSADSACAFSGDKLTCQASALCIPGTPGDPSLTLSRVSVTDNAGNTTAETAGLKVTCGAV